MLAPRLASLAARTCLRVAAPARTSAAAPTARRLARSASAMAEHSDKLGALSGASLRAEQPGGLGQARVAAAVDRRAMPAAEALVGDKLPAGAVPGRISPGRISPLQSCGTGARAVHTGAAATDAAGTTGGTGGARFARAFFGVSDEAGQRSHMEDRHTILPDFQLQGGDTSLPRQFVAVYDGHSGHRGSEHASRRVHEFIAAQPAIQQCKGESCDVAQVEAALKEAFEEVDAEIVEQAVQKGRRYGTTAVCVLRIGDTLYVAHAGDSRAVLCREGKGVLLTRDHKPASVPEERERIEAQGGRIAYDADRVHSNPEGQRQSRLNMSRALGDPDFKAPRRLVEAEPDVARVELRPGSDTFLLLGSDGLFEQLSVQQAVDIARQALAQGAGGGRPSDAAADAAADALIKQALAAGTRDNVTALLMLLDWQS